MLAVTTWLFSTVPSAIPTCLALGRVSSILVQSLQKLPPQEPLPHSAQEAVESWGSGGPWGLMAWVGTQALPIASRDSGQVNPAPGGLASPLYKMEM